MPVRVPGPAKSVVALPKFRVRRAAETYVSAAGATNTRAFAAASPAWSCVSAPAIAVAVAVPPAIHLAPLILGTSRWPRPATRIPAGSAVHEAAAWKLGQPASGSAYRRRPASACRRGTRGRAAGSGRSAASSPPSNGSGCGRTTASSRRWRRPWTRRRSVAKGPRYSTRAPRPPAGGRTRRPSRAPSAPPRPPCRAVRAPAPRCRR